MSIRIGHYSLKPFLVVCVFLCLARSHSNAQSNGEVASLADAPGPAFEVASIRPANPDDGRRWFGTKLDASGRFEASASTLSGLVYIAYPSAAKGFKVETDHTAPKWISSDVFDIEAKIDEGYMDGWSTLSDAQRMDIVRPMLRRLLSERFHLKLTTDTRMTPVYALVQAKGGTHVREVPPPTPVDGDPAEVAARWVAENPGKAFPGQIMCSGDQCVAHAVRIEDALGQIAANSHADRMVVDQTGLKGTYDFSFPFPGAKDEFPMQEVGDALGMKFEPRSMPIKTCIIESAEKPTVD